MSSKRSRNRVPVVHRRSDAERATAAKVARPRRTFAGFGAIELLALGAVLIIFLLTIALPLRNYFEQRTEIQQTAASIAQKQQRKDELLNELDKYRSKAYAEEQARNRLGVIAPGELSFRILDPHMQREDSVTSKGSKEKPETRPWFDTLWGSIAAPAQEATSNVAPDSEPEMHLPIKPTAVPEAPDVPADAVAPAQESDQH